MLGSLGWALYQEYANYDDCVAHQPAGVMWFQDPCYAYREPVVDSLPDSTPLNPYPVGSYEYCMWTRPSYALYPATLPNECRGLPLADTFTPVNPDHVESDSTLSTVVALISIVGFLKG